MRLVVTGGGTGGHVYPALEIARAARDRGDEVLYLGSLRGQEGPACQKVGMPFQGLPSQPLFSLRTVRGWKGLIGLLRARGQAVQTLRNLRPAVVFATGGYSSGPVVGAAQALGIPTVLHEQNSVPGRSNLMFARKARTVCSVFHATASAFPGASVVRTGMPIRRELRELAQGARTQDLLPLILVVGGSQGAQAINEAALGAATRMVKRGLHWLHATGKAHFEAVFGTYEKLALKDCYEVRPYLEGQAMAEAYARATLAVGRSGAGTLSELAAFRLPSVLVPYPHAFADHQRHNAQELADLGGAVVLDQKALTPALLEDAALGWLDDPKRVDQARAGLASWDVPDATERILGLLS